MKRRNKICHYPYVDALEKIQVLIVILTHNLETQTEVFVELCPTLYVTTEELTTFEITFVANGTWRATSEMYF